MCRERDAFRSSLLALVVLVGAGANANGAEEATAARPDPGGKATRVQVGVYVVDVVEIDDARRTFTADAYVILRWKDARLAKPGASRRALPLSAVWHPGALVFNQRNVTRTLPEVVGVDEGGNVECRQRYQGTFSIHLDLRKFPLDEQTLRVHFVTPGLSPAEIELVADERGGRAGEFSILDWAIGEPTTQADPLIAPDGNQVAGISVTLSARRQAKTYVYSFIIPLTFIVAMSWAPFWMAPENLAPRQGIAVTSMLTVIAYRFVLTAQLPRVAYLTRFDYLLLGCTTLVFLVLVEVVVAHRLMASGQGERARKMDVCARGVFPATFVALVAIASNL